MFQGFLGSSASLENKCRDRQRIGMVGLKRQDLIAKLDHLLILSRLKSLLGAFHQLGDEGVPFDPLGLGGAAAVNRKFTAELVGPSCELRQPLSGLGATRDRLVVAPRAPEKIDDQFPGFGVIGIDCADVLGQGKRRVRILACQCFRLAQHRRARPS